MNKEVQYKKLFRLSGMITDVFPNAGSKFLDAAIINILGNKFLLKYFLQKSKSTIANVKAFDKILVVGDLNIGDAIIASCGISALRKIFPKAEIDYTLKKSALNLIEGNKEISNLYPIYNSAPYPTENDLVRLNNVLNGKDYNLIVNFCPMIPNKFFGNRKVLSYTLMASELINNEGNRNSINNINFLAFDFILKSFEDRIGFTKYLKFNGPKIFLSDDALEKAQKYFYENNIPLDKPIIMLNPDASAAYTRMPFNFQLQLIKKLSLLQCTILIGAGHVEKNIEQRLLNYFSNGIDQNIYLVPPSIELDTYAAIIDSSDIFITGDTGPLHIAAARKFSKSTGKNLRNQTAVFSIFGSTPPHVYGYDSDKNNYLAANQDAPSKTFIAHTSCRNISCINKMAKGCKEVRCFKNLSIDEIFLEAINHLSTNEKFYFPQEDSIFAK